MDRTYEVMVEPGSAVAAGVGPAAVAVVGASFTAAGPRATGFLTPSTTSRTAPASPPRVSPPRQPGPAAAARRPVHSRCLGSVADASGVFFPVLAPSDRTPPNRGPCASAQPCSW